MIPDPEPTSPLVEDIDLFIEEPEPAPAPSPERMLTLMSRQVYPYLGKDVVIMLDENGEEYLIDVDRIDRETLAPQPVNVELAIRPYSWQEELEALVPDLETVYRNFRRSFYRAGAFDRSALQTRARNDLFNSAYPYKQQFFAGEE